MTTDSSEHNDIYYNMNVDVGDTNQLDVDEDISTGTTSLADTIYRYRFENGRTYHVYKDGIYAFPNDDKELNRLDLQHHIFNITFEYKLFHAPLQDCVESVLDVGTGTGIWAIEFADTYPKCQVIGTDLSPVQPTAVPPNLRFIIDDMEDTWVYHDDFDLVHMRALAGSFKDFGSTAQSAFGALRSGGWLEIQDWTLPCRSLNSTLDGTALEAWSRHMLEAAKKADRPLDCVQHYYKCMEETGFIDIQKHRYFWPTNGWPKDPKLKEIGRWNETNLCEGLEGFSLALFTKFLGWTRTEVETFCAKVVADIKNRQIHAYFPMRVVYGRKP